MSRAMTVKNHRAGRVFKERDARPCRYCYAPLPPAEQESHQRCREAMQLTLDGRSVPHREVIGE